MELVADEGVESGIDERLRLDGHSVLYIAESARQSDDMEVLRIANDNNAVLLTMDKDFGQLVFQQRLIHSGGILGRLAGLSTEAKAEIVSRAIRERGLEMIGAFAVVSPKLVRIRHRDVSQLTVPQNLTVNWLSTEISEINIRPVTDALDYDGRPEWPEIDVTGLD